MLLFFVHTSLVLMMSMERLRLSGRDLYIAFMTRRFFRIYPLSILSVLVVVCFRVPANSWLGGYQWAGWPAFVSNIFLTQNLTQSSSVNCVLWSLPFEIQMYALLPLFFLGALHFPSHRWMAGIWLVAAGIAAAEYIARSGVSSPDFLIARYFPCFLTGVFAWRLMTNRSGRKPRLPGWAWVVYLVALVLAYRFVDAMRVYGPGALATLHTALRNDHHVWWPPYFDLVNDWLFCAAAGLAIPLFLEIRSGLLKWISKQTARYSYGIYVSHVPVLWLCFGVWHPGSPAVSAALALLLTAVISILAYHCVEDPAIRAGKRVAAHLAQCRVLA